MSLVVRILCFTRVHFPGFVIKTLSKLIVTYHINLLKKYHRTAMMVCSEQNETPIRLEQIFPNDQTETLADFDMVFVI
jgi:hypothetical protein